MSMLRAGALALLLSMPAATGVSSRPTRRAWASEPRYARAGLQGRGTGMKIRLPGLAALFALLATAFAAQAARPATFVDKAEASLLLDGTVDIHADGTVERYSLDDSVKLPAAIVDLIEREISGWRFEPVMAGGKPVAARTNMSLRIVATPKGDGNYDARIGSVWFSGGADDKPPAISVRTRTGLVYPTFAEPVAMAGTVYVVLKIGPHGEVLDAAAEQVNLTTFGTNVEMAKARRILASNTLAAVRKWTFNVPATGDEAGRAYWIGVLPVKYGTWPSAGVGAWERYIPGPRLAIPWRDPGNEPAAAGIDALPEGTMALDGAGPKLLAH